MRPAVNLQSRRTRTRVEAMGGSIHVHSELGQGAAFTVELPLEPASR